MRPGTNGFVASRLKEAREARGLSATALADLVGVTAQSITHYEKGQHTPGPDVLLRISERLGLPPLFFLRPIPERGHEGALFFRSMSSAGKAERARASVQIRWLRDLTAYLFEYVEIPCVNLPNIQAPSDAVQLSPECIEDAAEMVRRHWGMGDGPISNVAWLLENNGVVIARMSLELDKFDGMSTWYDGRPYMVLNSDKESAARSRFDAAHELGHLILHRNVDQVAVNSGATFKLIEEQAHRFASAFLFPARSFALEVHPATLEHFVELKRRWRVSIAFMIRRAADLGILNERAEELMWRRLNFKRWRTCEPLDNELAVERPRLLQRAANMLLRSGVQRREDLLMKLPLSETDIERLAGLPRAYLSADGVDVIDLLPRLRSKEQREGNVDATVIPFRPRTAEGAND